MYMYIHGNCYNYTKHLEHHKFYFIEHHKFKNLHLEHPKPALWPTKPQDFLVAGTSHEQHVKAARMKTHLNGELEHGRVTPDHNSLSS